VYCSVFVLSLPMPWHEALEIHKRRGCNALSSVVRRMDVSFTVHPHTTRRKNVLYSFGRFLVGLLTNHGHRKLFTPVSRQNFNLPVRHLPTSKQQQSTRPAVRSSFAGILFGSPGQRSYGAKEAQLSGHLTCESLTSFTIFRPKKKIAENILAHFVNRMFVTVFTG
jgi:hypothetical protein